MNWLKWPLEHYPISLLIVGILFVLGIFGMYVMPKDEFPAFTIRQGVVVAVFPGATSEEVEEQVARPLEHYLFTFGEVNRQKTTTTAQNGMCIVMVRLNDDVNNKDEVWSKIKHGLNLFKNTSYSIGGECACLWRTEGTDFALCRSTATASLRHWPTDAFLASSSTGNHHDER